MYRGVLPFASESLREGSDYTKILVNSIALNLLTDNSL